MAKIIPFRPSPEYLERQLDLDIEAFDLATDSRFTPDAVEEYERQMRDYFLRQFGIGA